MPSYAWCVLLSLPLFGLLVWAAWLYRRLQLRVAVLEGELAAAGERIVIAPEDVSYRGAQFDYGRVKCNGTACVTDRRFIFIPLVGRRKEWMLDRIAGVGEAEWFLGCAVGWHKHLILHFDNGNKVGFFVRQHELFKQRLLEAGLREHSADEEVI